MGIEASSSVGVRATLTQTNRAGSQPTPDHLIGYRTDFHATQYKFDSVFFVQNPLQTVLKRAKLCLAKIGFSPNQCGQPTTAQVGMSARNNPPVAFAHLIAAAKASEGIFEFANSRTMISHLDHTFTQRALPDSPRFNSTTLGQIVKAFYENNGNPLPIGEGYVIDSVTQGIPHKTPHTSMAYKQLNAENNTAHPNTEARCFQIVISQATGGTRQTYQVPCVINYLGSFDGVDLQDDDLRNAHDLFKSLNNQCGNKTSQILSSTGCGRAAVLAAYHTVAQSKPSLATIQQQLANVFEQGKRFFHPKFGLNAKLQGTVRNTLERNLPDTTQASPSPRAIEDRRIILNHRTVTHDPYGLGHSLSQIQTPPINLSTLTPNNNNPRSPSVARDIHRFMGANHSYIEALNEFLGIRPGTAGGISTETFVNHTAQTLASAYRTEQAHPVRDEGAFATALLRHTLDIPDPALRNTLPAIRLQEFERAQQDLKKCISLKAQ